ADGLVGDVEGHAAGTVERKGIVVTRGDRTLLVHQIRTQHAADHAQVAGPSDRNTGRQTYVDREARRVLRRDQQAAFGHEALQVRDARFTQPGANVRRRIDA